MIAGAAGRVRALHARDVRHELVLHYNPAKHGLTAAPGLWPYSTFAKYVRLGEYEAEWGASIPANLSQWIPPGGFIE
jgi:hypothetical protein